MPVHPQLRHDPSLQEPCALVTGFEPFDGEPVNPSQQIAQALDGTRVHGVRVAAVSLPCRFDAARPALQAALRRHRPRWVLALGQASRPLVGIERVAINVIDARIPDNAGAQPLDEPVVPGGPAAYFATLPIKSMLARVRAAGIGVEVSQTAGTFVCNAVFYGLMHALRRRPEVRGGFVHVPLLPEQAARLGRGDGLPLQVQIRAVRLALEAAIEAPMDLRLGAGATD